MVIAGAEEQVKWLNSFPAKGRVSNVLSPRTILTGKPIDFIKQCKTHMGAYVLTHTEHNPTNTMDAQAISCIYLKPLDTHQGGHELLNLSTNKIITWRNYTEVPLTQLAKDRVHAIAEKENIEYSTLCWKTI